MVIHKFDLLHWVIAFIKDEGTSLIAMVATLYSIIDCEQFNILRVYEDTCFGHVVFKPW